MELGDKVFIFNSHVIYELMLNDKYNTGDISRSKYERLSNKLQEWSDRYDEIK